MNPSFATYPSLRGQRIFITGGGTGSGAAKAEAFAQQVAQVVCVDVARMVLFLFLATARCVRRKSSKWMRAGTEG